MLTEPSAAAGPLVDRGRDPDPERDDRRPEQLRRPRPSSAGEQVGLRRRRASAARGRRSTDARPADHGPTAIFVPPRSTPITRSSVGVLHGRAATIARRMARRREAVPRLPRRTRQGQGARRCRGREQRAGAHRTARRGSRAAPGPAAEAPARLGWGRGSRSSLGAARPAARRLGASRATSSSAAASRPRTTRLDRRTRAGARRRRTGCCSRQPTTILLLGTDHANRADRASAQRSDSIMLVRTDPERDRVYATSRSRATCASTSRARRGQDQRRVPGRRAGARDPDDPAVHRACRSTTSPSSTSASFRELVDAIGGIDVDVPTPILSNRFDCPYDAGRSAHAGRAGASARASSTWTAGARSSTRASARTSSTRPRTTSRAASGSSRCSTRSRDKLTGAGTLARLPFIGDDLLRPLATDLTTGQFVAARLAPLPRAGDDAALPARRRRRRRSAAQAVHRPDGGEPQRDRDVPRRVGAAAAAARLRTRTGRLRRRRQRLRSGASAAGFFFSAGFVVAAQLPSVASRPSPSRRRVSACATRGRSRSSRSPSP